MILNIISLEPFILNLFKNLDAVKTGVLVLPVLRGVGNIVGIPLIDPEVRQVSLPQTSRPKRVSSERRCVHFYTELILLLFSG